MTHWTVDTGSVCGIGRSQTGKSSIAKEVFATSNRLCIWLNMAGTQREEGISTHADAVVQGIDGLERALANDAWKIEFVSNNRERDVVKLKNWLWEKAEMANREMPFTLFIDEFHLIAPESNKKDLPGRDAVVAMAKQGMKRNIKLWSITQEPQEADKSVYRNREYLYVTSVTTEQRDMISGYANDLSDVNNSGEYVATVYHAEGHEIGRVKAQEKYA